MKRILKISGAAILGLFVVLVIIGAIVGGGKNSNSKQQVSAARTSSTHRSNTAARTSPSHRSTISAPAHTSSAPPSSTTAKTSTSTSTASAVPLPAPAPKPAHACVDGGQYGGIGAAVAAFKKQNPTAANPPPSEYLDGIAFYEIKGTARGCVTDYTITMSTTPTQSSRDLLSLLAGISIPSDAQQVVNQDTCGVWKSAALQRATGKPYAVGFVVVAPQGDATGIAEMSVSATPRC